MASIEEKQIAKDFVLKMIEAKAFAFHNSGSDKDDTQNVEIVKDAFSQILETVSQKG